jgi:hypothetical protein
VSEQRMDRFDWRCRVMVRAGDGSMSGCVNGGNGFPMRATAGLIAR